MGYHSYFALKVADYGMTVDEMMKLLDDTLATTKPLYDGLHCWAKNQLAARYKRPPPKLIPAHWIGNRWAQSWPGLVEAANLDPLFKGSSPETIVKSAESFYVSLGFPKLPPSFWERSDLYPVPPGPGAQEEQPRLGLAHRPRAGRPLADERRAERAVVRHRPPRARPHLLLPLVQPARGAVPAARGREPRLSRGDRRAGQAGQPADALPGEDRRHARRARRPTPTGWLLQSALDSIVFLPWSAGHDEPLRARPLRERAAARRMAGASGGTTSPSSRASSPPGGREPELCDACTKTHINDDAAEYYDYALATLIKFQLHDHICTKILKQDVRACDYSGNKEVGAFLKGILSLGATRDWRDGHQGRDRRADLAARDDGVLRAAGRRAGEAQRRQGLRALIARRSASVRPLGLALRRPRRRPRRAATPRAPGTPRR